MADPTPQADRNAMLGAMLAEQLIAQLIAPRTIGAYPDGSAILTPSPIAAIAQQMWQQQQHEILRRVLPQVDRDAIADQVAVRLAEHVVKELSTPGSTYNPNPTYTKLRDRILEIVAQTLGQRVVDQMDLQLGPKEVTP